MPNASKIPSACGATSLLKHKSSFFLMAPVTLLINCGSSFNNFASLNNLSIKACAFLGFVGGVGHTIYFLSIRIERNHRVLDLVILEATQPNSLQ